MINLKDMLTFGYKLAVLFTVLNTQRIISRLNNRLNNKNRLSEQERSTACSQYMDDDDLSDSTSERGFGCTGNENPFCFKKF